MSDQARDGLETAARYTADATAAAVTVSTLFDFLPGIAAIISIIWMMIRIYETHTIQRMLGREPVKKQGED